MRDSVNLSYRMSSILHSKFNLRLRLWEMQRRTLVCDTMMSCDNINVQAIDYPAVGKGEELLRIARPHSPDDGLLF